MSNHDTHRHRGIGESPTSSKYSTVKARQAKIMNMIGFLMKNSDYDIIVPPNKLTTVLNFCLSCNYFAVRAAASQVPRTRLFVL